MGKLFIRISRRIGMEMAMARVEAESADRDSPKCPSCGRDMQLGRMIADDRDTALWSFECRPCGLTIMQAQSQDPDPTGRL
jgi:hypothetical protein